VPYVVSRIISRDGKIIYERAGEGLGAVVNARSLGAMNSMLREVIQSGTGRRAQMDGQDVAGKTGTSQDYRDAWFLGYSAYLVGGVWMGNDDNSPTNRVTGGSIPAAIWKDIMQPAHRGLQYASLPGDYETLAQGDGSGRRGGLFDIFREMLSGTRARSEDDMGDFIDQFEEPQPRKRRKRISEELKKMRDRR
jgi:penicillin-binding protein 1A